MSTGTLADLGAWIKRKQSSTKRATLYKDGAEAHTRSEATAMICQHWQDVWREIPVDQDRALEALVSGFGPVSAAHWKGLSFEDVLFSVRHCKGGAGPDQWSGPEIRYMPEAAVRVFFSITRCWEVSGCLPLQLKQARQITLCKEGKMEAEGLLHVKHTRPITVMSCFWRVYASSWTRNAQLCTWVQAHLHESVAFGKGMAGAEDLVARLQDHFSTRKGFLASLDWSAAYDRMQPQVSARFIEALGLPSCLATLISEAWGRQRRFIQFEGHTHHVGLEAGAATPQGCPLAPLMLNLWASAGARAVESRVGDPEATVCTYMDDRSWHSNRWEAVQGRIEGWSAFSASVGLKEAAEKVQLVARGAQYQAIMSLHANPLWIKSEAKVLGASSVSKPRRQTEAEEDRLRKAREKGALLRTVQLPWMRMLWAHRSFVISTAAYGWTGRWPTQGSCDKLFTSLSQGFGTGYVASRDLRKVLYGGTVHLASVLLARAWQRLRRAKASGFVPS